MGKAPEKMWRAANQSAAVRNALVAKARQVAARAEAISRAEGGTATYSLDVDIRPGGRVRVNVHSDNRDEEYGTEDTPRIGALRRAAKGG